VAWGMCCGVMERLVIGSAVCGMGDVLWGYGELMVRFYCDDRYIVIIQISGSYRRCDLTDIVILRTL